MSRRMFVRCIAIPRAAADVSARRSSRVPSTAVISSPTVPATW